MSERISIDEFHDFVRPFIVEVRSHDELPSWLKAYWAPHRTTKKDLAALFTDLDAKATRAEEFIARFVAWKLKR